MALSRLRDRVQTKNFDRWLGGLVAHRLGQIARPSVSGTKHLLFALCDHHEPLWGGADDAVGKRRVRRWLNDYPKMSEPFRDADGRRPQHTFFFPGEEYRAATFDMLDELVRMRCGEVELHLHHDDATEQSMRSDIERYLELYARRGHFARSRDGRLRYGFIHGNWCLANARPDGRKCGVDAELPLLFDTGCYADFTFPSAPDVSQPNIVNSLYWPTGNIARRRAYEWGRSARVGERYTDRILMIQGPLALTTRAGSLAIRIENGAVTANDPGTPTRVEAWVRQHIHVHGQPEWVFVKVYTHGAPEKQAQSLLGNDARILHEHLASTYNDGTRWVLHYVTAREMFNIAVAAMEGLTGNPNDYRDHELPPPPIVAE